MPRVSRKSANATRSSTTAKYDANNIVLEKTYGAFAGLRRELSDSKAAVTERTERLQSFAHCADPQRAWLLLEDYFERLSLSRRDFAGEDWWPRLMATQGKARLEETARDPHRAGDRALRVLVGFADVDHGGKLRPLGGERRDVELRGLATQVTEQCVVARHLAVLTGYEVDCNDLP